MSECVIEKPVLRACTIKEECSVKVLSVPKPHVNYNGIKKGKHFQLNEKSRLKLFKKSYTNPRYFEELIPVDEIRRGIHYRNYGSF